MKCCGKTGNSYTSSLVSCAYLAARGWFESQPEHGSLSRKSSQPREGLAIRVSPVFIEVGSGTAVVP
eukprot:1214917-Prorocentrum_lima.AAC.1